MGKAREVIGGPGQLGSLQTCLAPDTLAGEFPRKGLSARPRLQDSGDQLQRLHLPGLQSPGRPGLPSSGRSPPEEWQRCLE